MKTPKPIEERRRAIRIQETLPFQIGHDGYECEVHTLNISTNGALCRIDKEIPVMTKLKILLTLPGPGGDFDKKKRMIPLEGVVVRRDKDPETDQYFTAIYFSKIRPKDEKNIREFIEQRLKP